ncbi:hypothetical protein H0H87_002995, partial [Tephrocybe sp. NHM501043]
ASAHLKKELNSVLSLQGQTEAIDHAIYSLQAELSKVDAPEELIKLLSNLQQMQHYIPCSTSTTLFPNL